MQRTLCRTFTLLGVLYSFIFDDRDNHTLRRGLLHYYVAWAFQSLSIDNGAIRPRILYVGLIIITTHFINFLNNTRMKEKKMRLTEISSGSSRT